MKFVPDRAVDIASIACPRLADVKAYEQGAELYLGVEMIKDAIDMYIEGELWPKAKQCAAEMAPRLVKDIVSLLFLLSLSLSSSPPLLSQSSSVTITIVSRHHQCFINHRSFISRYEQYVEDAYVNFLKNKGQAEQVQNLASA